MNHLFIIFSNNRPLLLEQCIEYFIQNNYPRKNIVIFDNSSENYRLKINKIANIHQLQLVQNKTKSLGEHFVYALNLCDSDYVTFFHDDDLINIDYYEYLKNIELFLEKRNSISINLNGYHFENNKIPIYKNVLWNSDNDVFKILKKNLIERYLDNDRGGIAPWSGYIYNLKIFKKKIIEIINNLNLNNPYFDTHLILQLLDYGDIYWINRKAYLIRLHEGSISYKTLSAYKSFINFVNLNYPLIEKKSIKKYRYRNLLAFLVKKKKLNLLKINLATYLFFNSSSLRKLMLKKVTRLKLFN